MAWWHIYGAVPFLIGPAAVLLWGDRSVLRSVATELTRWEEADARSIGRLWPGDRYPAVLRNRQGNISGGQKIFILFMGFLMIGLSVSGLLMLGISLFPRVLVEISFDLHDILTLLVLPPFWDM